MLEAVRRAASWLAGEGFVPRTDPACTTLWRQVVEHVKGKVRPVTFQTWVATTVALGVHRGKFYVAVPAEIWLRALSEPSFAPNLASAMADGVRSAGIETPVKYVVRDFHKMREEELLRRHATEVA